MEVPYIDHHLCAHGAIVVNGFPDLHNDSEFLRFGNALGIVKRHSLRATTRALELNPGALVYSIEVKPDSMRNEQGQLILSNTSDEFPCHTDEYFLQTPSNTVLSLCCHEDNGGGGMTLLADVADIVTTLPAHCRASLQCPSYPHPDGSVPILSVVKGRWKIRYNWGYMKGLLTKRGHAVSEEMADVLAQLEDAIRRVQVKLMLRSGDCLVFDNHRILHGRTPFDATSGRKLKRIRVHRLDTL